VATSHPKYYSPEDVARWKVAYAGSIDLHLQRLSDPGLPDQQYDFHLGMVSLSYHAEAMLCLAECRFEDAVEAFRASIEARCRMYERFVAGRGRPVEAGAFQSVLVALATRDEALIAEIGRHYRADVGTAGSIFIGSALRCLVLDDIHGARIALDCKWPRFERQFVGYAESLQAIAAGDDQQFLAALALASESWANWAARQVRGLPDSVCFIHGVGLVRLAERVFGHRVPMANVRIPPQLVQ
jgi:hypothetical protein